MQAAYSNITKIRRTFWRLELLLPNPPLPPLPLGGVGMVDDLKLIMALPVEHRVCR
jgi:hypothetical protein